MQYSEKSDVYDMAVDYAYFKERFTYESLKSDLGIDDALAEWAVSKMVYNNVITELKPGEFNITGDGRCRSLETEEMPGSNVKRRINSFFNVFSLLVFMGSCYLLAQEPVSIIILASLSLLVFYACSNYSFIPFNLGISIIITCVIVVFYVHSQTPLWGDGRLRLDMVREVKKQALKESNEEADQIVLARNYIRSSMKDPGSAKFSGEYVSHAGSVCGYVNGKNGFGAYAGNQRFVVVGSSSYIDDGTQGFSSLWKDNCL